jgi:hypothetical protein
VLPSSFSRSALVCSSCFTSMLRAQNQRPTYTGGEPKTGPVSLWPMRSCPLRQPWRGSRGSLRSPHATRRLCTLPQVAFLGKGPRPQAADGNQPGLWPPL